MTSDSILLVEDDVDTRLVIHTYLTNAGYPVIAADNGQQAVDLLSRGVRPRLLIVDLMLPRVSGEEVIRFAHEDPSLRHTPVIAISAAPRLHVKVIADAIITKPFRLPEILDTVRRLIERIPAPNT
jgi:two-component system cell cycle response regulator DivK